MTEPYTRAEVELRITALNKTLDTWKRDNGYARLISMEIWALELALAHLVRQELMVAQVKSLQPSWVSCPNCGCITHKPLPEECLCGYQFAAEAGT